MTMNMVDPNMAPKYEDETALDNSISQQERERERERERDRRSEASANTRPGSRTSSKKRGSGTYSKGKGRGGRKATASGPTDDFIPGPSEEPVPERTVFGPVLLPGQEWPAEDDDEWRPWSQPYVKYH